MDSSSSVMRSFARRYGLQWGHGFSSMDSLARRMCQNLIAVLQWGHGFSSMDRPFRTTMMPGSSSLQWGHGFSSMDSSIGSMAVTPVYVRFNGAMDFHPWIEIGRAFPTIIFPCFNGAMDFHPWIVYLVRSMFTPKN